MTERKTGFLLAVVLLLAAVCIALLFLSRSVAALLPFPLDNPEVLFVSVAVNSAEGETVAFDLTAQETEEFHALLRETKARLTDWPVNGITYRNSPRIYHISADKPGESASLACLEDGRLYIGSREYRMDSNAITDFLEEAMAQAAE